MSKDSSGKFRTFEDLDCWQACRKLRVFAAGICKNLKQNEEYRLRDQVLRAARRITASIAEGYGRYHYQETAQYCRSARGSAYEVLDHFITGVDEGLLGTGPRNVPESCGNQRALAERLHSVSAEQKSRGGRMLNGTASPMPK